VKEDNDDLGQVLCSFGLSAAGYTPPFYKGGNFCCGRIQEALSGGFTG
jgi:hypothetical protein